MDTYCMELLAVRRLTDDEVNLIEGRPWREIYAGYQSGEIPHVLWFRPGYLPSVMEQFCRHVAFSEITAHDTFASDCVFFYCGNYPESDEDDIGRKKFDSIISKAGYDLTPDKVSEEWFEATPETLDIIGDDFDKSKVPDGRSLIFHALYGGLPAPAKP